jgi:hypothetical protein
MKAAVCELSHMTGQLAIWQVRRTDGRPPPYARRAREGRARAVSSRSVSRPSTATHDLRARARAPYLRQAI